MRLISSKKNSSRERVECEVAMLSIPNWRIVWSEPEGGNVKAQGRNVVLSSAWRNDGDRTYELWLTEEEANGIAKLVVDRLFNPTA